MIELLKLERQNCDKIVQSKILLINQRMYVDKKLGMIWTKIRVELILSILLQIISC